MPAFRIPVTKGTWRGQYQGDYYGDVRRSFGVDLERKVGEVELSERHKFVFSDSSDTNFRRVEAFVKANMQADSGTRFYASTFDGFDTVQTRFTIYRSTDTNGDTAWASDTRSSPGNTFFAVQDMVNFPQAFSNTGPRRLFASTGDTQVIFLPDTTGAGVIEWQNYSATLSVMDSGIFHPLDVFEGSLLVGNHNTVSTLDNVDSTILIDRVTIEAGYDIHHIFNTPGTSWLLAANESYQGIIAEWDGFSILPRKSHGTPDVPLTGVNYYGLPIVLMSSGRFLQLSGSGYTPLRDPVGNLLCLPVNNERDNSLLGQISFPLDPSKFSVARRGMVVDGEVIKMNLAQSRTQVFGEFNQNSGIWVLNPIKKTLYNSTPMAGDNNFGHGFVRRSGAMFVSQEGGIKLASGRFYDSYDTTNKAAIIRFKAIDDSTVQRGFFESQWLHIPEPEASWETLWIKHRPITDTNVRILAKARIQEGPFIMDSDIDLYGIAQVDFDDDTAFFVQLSSTLSDSLIVGDEIEMLAGPNAGKLAHITSISGAHGDTQTISIDESFDSSASLSAATFRRWKKLTAPNGDSSIVAGDTLVVHRFTIPASIRNAPKISFKLELRGRVRDITIEEMAVQYEVAKETKI